MSGPTPAERFRNGWFAENPVYRQLLGLCPTLAVTNTLAGAITMALATTFVLGCANLIVSCIRGLLQPHLRILVFTMTIATFVTVVDRFLAAFLPAMSAQLGPYIPLIIVNCLIISRCEICSSKQGPVTALADAAGMGGGFLLTLTLVAGMRELLGTGGLFGVTWQAWPDWTVMILPPGAFFALGILLGVANWMNMKPKPASAHGA